MVLRLEQLLQARADVRLLVLQQRPLLLLQADKLVDEVQEISVGADEKVKRVNSYKHIFNTHRKIQEHIHTRNTQIIRIKAKLFMKIL